MNEPSLDTWTTIFFLAAIQGIFLASAIFLQKSKIRRANIYLATFVLLFSLMLLDYFSYWSNYRMVFPYVFGFSFGFPFWYGPILYLYLRELNQHSKGFVIGDLLHFVPGIIYYFTLAPYLFLSGPEKIQLFTTGEAQTIVDFLTVPVLKISHMLLYTFLSFRLIETDSRKENLQKFYSWQKLFVGLFLLFILSSTTYYVLVATVNFKVEYDYMISMTMATAIYTIGFIGYRQPQIIHGFEEIKSKYENLSLRKEEAPFLIERITRLLEEDKIYLENDLKLPEVAGKLNVSPHHLSQVVNEHLQLSFPDLINSYRVDEVKRKLINPEHSEDKIIGIAFDCGFNNKANFNNAFKKFTGMSPSDYRKLHQLEYMN